ncbi:uncharacterized protein C11orf16 homolog isoform X1 [Mauremys reevesii]|uniref:uncharacterized protein C11orf16 homolog isoform X1 n=1 Tax=Mauremys reevesii TaxID=260615 RepID=UPI00193FE77B|nr:uncharacterized protein C11orf16 homolog isoform X1 [Mauremys reevesii]XP_039394705.1 uncharacterized protein C11orf16 homolog isoform X1 [Mauremys reevesii]XP_039394706.1 uncharacterized protein C11orf16 homolog isoform X1 [Mauremys reevesii]
MENPGRSLCTEHMYCRAVTALDKLSCSNFVTNVDPFSSSSFIVHPAWVTRPLIPQRCSWIGHCPHFPDTACKGLKVWEKSVDIAHVPVLARRDSDGFYYLGTIKQEIEGKRGTYLVEFDKPLASGDKYSVCVQKTARDDILEYVNGMRHSILPGDKVLAPWEPDLARYGPGTILLGIETRDPLRASEDEEIMVCFWNDKKVKVPLGVALWIPPDTWERIVEMIHMPFTSRLKLTNPTTTTSSYTSTCRLLSAPIHSCALDNGLSKYRWPWPWPFICPPFHSHCHSICCSPVHVGCICCSHPKFSAWRPLLSTSLLPQRSTKQQESNNKPTAQLLELESPKENERAAAATTAASSSSSSSDLESEEEMGLTKSMVVDSAVNTDSSLFKKPKLKDAARPEWKYWKRSHTKSHPRNPGISIPSSKCTKGKAESGTIFSLDMHPVAPTNQSAMFETIEQSPRRHLTLKDVLIYHDFKPSGRPQATPFLEKLGENQIECERQRRACMEQKRKKKIQQQQRECEREQQAEEKYYTAQEHRRNKKLQHFENEDKKVKEQDRKQNQTMKTKQLAQQRTNLKMQTMAEEDRQKGQQRLAHLQRVRDTHDEREFNKCIDEEIKEKQSQEARRRRVETQYKLMAEKISQDEKQKGK